MAKPSTAPKAGKDIGILRHLWLSPWTGWVGLRYLKSKKNSRFLSFITLLSILGVGLGVTAMIVVLSVMDGFEAELKKRLMATDLHILIQPTTQVQGFDKGFVPTGALDVKRIEAQSGIQSQVESFHPIVSTEAIMKLGKSVTGIVFKGVTEDRLARLKSQVVDSAEAPRGVVAGGDASKLQGVYVGQELAYEIGILPGDQVTLISPTETEGPLSNVPRLKKYYVQGVYRSGIPEQELHTVFASDQAVRSFLRRADVVSQWEVTVKNFDDAPAVGEAIAKLAPGFRVQDWIQLNAHLFQSLRLERTAMFVILAFIIVVASFNIVTTLTLMVLEKKKEISILKAMGARHGQVAAIFLAEGLLIGALGVFGGTGFGLLICSLLRRYEFITLPDVFYDRTLPVTFDVGYYIGVSICAFLIVIVACLYPSRRAARLNPLDGIRFG